MQAEPLQRSADCVSATCTKLTVLLRFFNTFERLLGYQWLCFMEPRRR
jgi:hypothetical protein